MWAIDTPGCIQVGSSLERQANCGHTLRAITCLMGLTGNIERPGSMISWVLPDTGLIEDFNLELPITDEMKSKIIGGDRFKMGATRTCNPDTMVKAINDGKSPIKVWFSVGGQQIVHMANTKEVVAAIEKVEFMSHTDLFMGPMAEAADIVLPAAHWLELDDVYDMHPRFMIEAHNKVVDPPGEAKSDAWIFNEIGRRVVPDKWWDNVDDMLDYQLSGARARTAARSSGRSSARSSSAAAGAPTRCTTSTRPTSGEKAAASPPRPASSSSSRTTWSRWATTRCRCSPSRARAPISTPELYKEYPHRHEQRLPPALLLPGPVPQHPVAAQLHGVPHLPDASGDGQAVRRRGRRHRLDRVAARAASARSCAPSRASRRAS